MNRRLAVVAFVMLVLTSAMGLRNALGRTGNQTLTANGSTPAPVMVAKDGGVPLPSTPW